MLILSFKKNEFVPIGDTLFRLVEIRGDKVRLEMVAAIDPAWLTWNDGTVLRLARAIAEQGNYDALPILADALEDAGCTAPAILDHCRSGCPDARSSWMVRFILSAAGCHGLSRHFSVLDKAGPAR